MDGAWTEKTITADLSPLKSTCSMCGRVAYPPRKPIVPHNITGQAEGGGREADLLEHVRGD